MAESTGMKAASSSIHSILASPDESSDRKSVEIQQSQKNSQKLVPGLIPGGTFDGCTLTLPSIFQEAVPSKIFKD